MVTNPLLDPNESSPDGELIARDLASVEDRLLSGVRSTDLLPRELGEYLVTSGGKRLRPLLMILTFRGLKQPGLLPRVSDDDLHTLASVAEWTHTATLFHDDVLDDSEKRRDKPSAHILHGNKVAILVGDFVYAEAFALLMERGLLEPSRELASTIKRLVEGELLQHRICQDRSLDLNEYHRIARAKTAALFSWCTWTGAWGAGHAQAEWASEFGDRLGHAFQMADDFFDTYALDLTRATSAELAEWAESAPPYPVVMAARNHPSIVDEWKSLSSRPAHELSDAIQRILEPCREPALIESCHSEIERLLKDGENLLNRLGSIPSLKTAVQLIRDRANAAINLSKGQRPQGAQS